VDGVQTTLTSAASSAAAPVRAGTGVVARGVVVVFDDVVVLGAVLLGDRVVLGDADGTGAS